MSEQKNEGPQFVMPENIEGKGEPLAIAEEDIAAGEVFAYIKIPSGEIVPTKKIRFLPGARERLLKKALWAMYGPPVSQKEG